MNRLVQIVVASPEARKRRVARKRVDSVVAAAVRRLLAEGLDLSPEDLYYHARLSVNAAKGGRARAKKLSASRRQEIARLANAAKRARR
jgi:hypothetical protein